MEVCDCKILNRWDIVSYKEIRLPPDGYIVDPNDIAIIEYDIVIDSLIEDCYNVVTSATFGFKPGKHRCYNATVISELKCGNKMIVSCSGM